MDSIAIFELEVPTHIGVPDAERAKEQIVKISIWLNIDIRAAAKSDNVDDSIDYADVASKVIELGKTERKTVERLVEDIAEMILKTYKTETVTVSARKLILQNTEGVAITITRP